MVQSRSRGVPRWLVLLGGVALGVALVGGYVLTNLPPQARDMMRASYERGYEAGRAGKDRRVRSDAVRRTPLAIPTPR